LVVVAPVAPSLGTTLPLSPAEGASATGAQARSNGAAASADRRGVAPVGPLAPADTTDRPTLCARSKAWVGGDCLCDAKRLCMAHLTVKISAVANRLCAVLSVADNGELGDYLGRAGTAPFIMILTTVVLKGNQGQEQTLVGPETLEKRRV
jgi:hypothetical protein